MNKSKENMSFQPYQSPRLNYSLKEIPYQPYILKKLNEEPILTSKNKNISVGFTFFICIIFSVSGFVNVGSTR